MSGSVLGEKASSLMELTFQGGRDIIRTDKNEYITISDTNKCKDKK